MESRKKKERRTTVAGKIYLYNFLLVLIMVMITGGASLSLALTIRQRDMDTTIRNLSQMVSELEVVHRALESEDVTGTYSGELGEELDLLVNSFEQVDVLVVCDTDSLRYYHSNHARIGEKFQGDDQGQALLGAAPYISEARGTLGMQRRAFTAVRDADGKLLGFVVASVLTSSLTHIRNQIIGIFALIFLVLGAVGGLLAGAWTYYIRQILLGYQPEEFSRLYVERTEVMDTLEEGIFAVNTEGSIILMNQSAETILNLPSGEKTEGKQLKEVYPGNRLLHILETGAAELNVSEIIEGKNILSSRIPIYHQEKLIGAVSILRNKTEVTRMAEELTGAKYMVDTLRAFNHEFMNKLHVILGFLEMKESEKAKNYIMQTSLVSGQAVSQISHLVPIPGLAALLIGKLIRANELGITFRLKSDSYFAPKENLLPPDCYVTIVGNLLENAMDELNSRELPVKEIELGIYSEEGHTIITCDDTGGGIPEEILFSIYDQHTTTKGEGHGTGMHLIRELTDCYQGTIHIDTEPGMGTSIEIILPV